MATCTTCGSMSVDEQAFHEERIPFRAKIRYYCNNCWAKRQRELLPLTGLLLFVLFGSVVAATWFAGQEYWDAVFWQLGAVLLFLPLFLCLAVLLHEFGHAVVARLLGWRVFSIALGTGRTIWRFPFAGFRFEIKAMPFDGFVTTAAREPELYRLKYFLLIPAGPAVNWTVLAITFWLWAPIPFRLDRVSGAGTSLLLVGLWSFANLLVAAFTLLPYRIKMDLGAGKVPVNSDGLNLLITPFMRQAAVRQAHGLYFYMEGLERSEARDYQGAKDWHLRALAQYPDDLLNRMGLAFTLLFLKDFHGARENWLAALHYRDLAPAVKPILLNNVAAVNLVIGGPELMAEADQFSQGALQVRASYPPFLGTRGSFLIERGEAEAGLPMVRSAFSHNTDVRLKAIYACYVAMGECKRGNHNEARSAVALAQSLDAECILLERVEREMAADATASHADRC